MKYHFNVSNSYVIKKLRLLVFPWRHKPWSRHIRRTENNHSEWQPPRDDINSPDLYIPRECLYTHRRYTHLCFNDTPQVMALVTYILLAALHSGLQSRFHPEILGVTASKALAVVLLDFLFVKLGCYFLNIQVSQLMLCFVCKPKLISVRAPCPAKCWIYWPMTATNLWGEFVVYSLVRNIISAHLCYEESSSHFSRGSSILEALCICSSSYTHSFPQLSFW